MKKLFLLLMLSLSLVACSQTEDKLKEQLNQPAEVQLAENEVAVSFGEQPFTLNGTLAMPDTDKAVPAVVLVPSFGPSDRDLTVYQNKIFKDIANGLSAEGIAVLRYDKMRFTYPERTQKLIEEGKFTVYDDVVDDAVMALKYLENVEGIDKQRIYLLGYGFGGNQSPRILKAYPNLKGLVLLGAYVSPLQELMLKQYDYLLHLEDKVDARSQEIYDRALEFSEQIAKDNFNEKSVIDEIGSLGMPYSYWVDLRTYNPATELAKTELPILVLQAERDYETDMLEFNLWQQSLTKAEFITYPHLNHLFIAGSGQSTPTEYQNQAQVNSQVISDITTFINKQQ